MLILDSAGRCIAASTEAILDRALLTHARIAIEKSLQLLRESAPENYLGRNYYKPRLVPPKR
jgi:hypothetical protein